MSRMILLADDSITIQKIVNLTFSGEGIDVVTVGNGDAALKKIHEHRPSLVLADIFMPGKNGYEVCEVIKNDVELQSIPVILLVGAFEPFDGHEASRVKADSHLTKPFEIKALISAVRTLIDAAEQQATVMIEPKVAASVALPETEDLAEPVPSPEIVAEPIDSAASRDPALEEAAQAKESTATLPLEAEPLPVIPEEIPEPEMSREPLVEQAQPVAFDRAISSEPEKKPFPVIEEADPLGLESVEDGLGLAGVPANSLTDNKSLVVEIWEPAEVPVVAEQPWYSAEVLPHPSMEAESEISELAPSTEPQTETISEMPASKQDVSSIYSVPLKESSMGIHEVAGIDSSSPSTAPLSLSLGDTETAELVEKIANKVVEKLSREVIEKIAWEVIPDMAVLMIKDQVESHFKTINDR